MIFLEALKRKTIPFFTGAFGYGLIEVIWRGYTHWSMCLAGGICFCALSKISASLKGKSLLLKAVAGSVFITAIEFIFGLIFNIILKKKIWDYSHMPFNLLGQICLLYSVFWVILCIFFIPLADRLTKR